LFTAPIDVKPVLWPRTASAHVLTGRHRKAAEGHTEGSQTAPDAAAVLEQETRKAYDNGFRAGQAAALQSSQTKIDAMTQQLAAAVSDLAGTRAELIRRAEGDLVRLAVEIARRTLHQ